ncbi:MAG: NUDIX hydrolase [Rhodothermales bacterium]|nr:NUDIX hydrolase [Rhodothermales bacterium]
MLRPWIVLYRQYLLERPWMRLRADHVRQPDGTEIEEFHVVEYPDWTCVLCFTEAGRVVLVEQYRHGIEQVSLELPAGIIDAGETPLMAARRELREETGYVADAWTPLGRCAPNPSKQTNHAYFFAARGARREHAQLLDASEAIAVRETDPASLLRLADEGGIVHGIHQAAIFRAHARGLVPGAEA